MPATTRTPGVSDQVAHLDALIAQMYIAFDALKEAGRLADEAGLAHTLNELAGFVSDTSEALGHQHRGWEPMIEAARVDSEERAAASQVTP